MNENQGNWCEEQNKGNFIYTRSSINNDSWLCTNEKHFLILNPSLEGPPVLTDQFKYFPIVVSQDRFDCITLWIFTVLYEN